MVHEAGLLYPVPSATLNPLLEVNLTYPFHHADDRNFEFLTRLACPRPRFNLHPAADRYGASVQVCMSTPMRSCSSQRESPSSAESTRQRVENGNGWLCLRRAGLETGICPWLQFPSDAALQT